MRKGFGLLILLLTVVLLLSAMNQSFINKLKFEKYFDALDPQVIHENALFKAVFVHSDKWRYGDLYGLSYLHQYKFKLEPFKSYLRKPGSRKTGKILYIVGDSFLADKTLSGAFDQFDNVIFFDRRFDFGPVKPDPAKQNYLVMEFAERNLVDYDIDSTFEVLATNHQVKNGRNSGNTPKKAGTELLQQSVWKRLNNIIFNPELSRNLELMLFDNTFVSRFKEFKASINYHLFDRVANEVSVSTDKKRLFFNITVDTARRQSSFKPQSEQAIDSICHNLQTAKLYYQSIGFKKVFLSVIPNPVSIYDAEQMPYNHLLERVEKKTDLSVISIYHNFKTEKRNLFYRSDSHWNPLGLDIWVHEMNRMFTEKLK
ncbi:MAG: hypothetical protein WC615_06670 [Mucilaginibacter sp.]|jgi:hypothetical protein|uniref:hypothetical protein n=1 Tax=Mucilaginibacter sp. TaxID=1882438 RepID=UPI0035664C5D